MSPRTPLKNRVLPNYSRGDEIANMVTHIIGAVLGIVVTVLAVLRAKDVWGIVGGAVFGGTMSVLYTVSAVYHGLHPCMGKKVMQVIDHCTIYFLIVGSYTPVLLSGIRPAAPVAAWTIFGVEWGLTAVACVFTAIDHKKYRVMSMLCYLGMGWAVVMAVKPLIEQTSWECFAWLLAGGISYTVGAVLYGVGKKWPIMHTVFHVLCVLGSALQAHCILAYIL